MLFSFDAGGEAANPQGFLFRLPLFLTVFPLFLDSNTGFFAWKTLSKRW